MTDANGNAPDRASAATPTVWVVNGVLNVTDSDLPTALRMLADHAEFRHPGLRAPTLSGIILHGRLRLAWHVGTPTARELGWLDSPAHQDTGYRLLTLTVTPVDRPEPPPPALDTEGRQ